MAPTAREQAFPAPSRRAVWGAAGLIALAAAIAYANSFSSPFLFDDRPSIVENESIRSLGAAWNPPVSAGTGGRPLLNFSFAVNYALGGLTAGGYHALNLLIHIGAGLALFGVMRRTLRRPVLSGRFGAAALPLALAVAAIWTLHPLQTSSVSYLSQRAESLMGLWYLLTLYAFVRSVDSPAPGRWQALAVGACLLGMTTKEVTVTAPLMVALYDRTFVAGGWAELWKRRRCLYLGLAATWLPLPWLMSDLGERGAGYVHGVTAWSYALTECRVVVEYLGLMLWPHPLVFDYGPAMDNSVAAAAPFAVVLVALLAGAVVALRRRPVSGFLGAWYFVVLAPTSSIVPVALQPMGENRTYLPLIAVIALMVLGSYAWLGRRCLVGWLAVALAWGGLTWVRNTDYRTEFGLWEDTVAKKPENGRAQHNMGRALEGAGRFEEAIVCYERVLRLLAESADTHSDLAKVLCQVGRTAEGIAHYETALRLEPGHGPAANGYGMALMKANRPAEAAARFEAALRGNERFMEARLNLGAALMQLGRAAEALRHFERALQIDPESAPAHCNYGLALFQQGREPEAVAHYETALRLRPDFAVAHVRLGDVAYRQGRAAEALEHYRSGVRLRPSDAEASHKLGLLLMTTGRQAEAVEFFREAARVRTDRAEAQDDLGNALAQAGRQAEAIAVYEEALRLQPDYADAHFDLGVVRLQTKQWAAAMAQFEAVVRLAPDNVDAHYNLGYALEQSGREAEAVRQYEAALRVRSDYAAAREGLARLRGQAAPNSAR